MTIPATTDRFGRESVFYAATIARTDTSAKNLFTLPAGADVVAISYYGPANSDAGTTATISVGKSGGTGTEYINAANVKAAATGQGQVTPNAQAMGAVGSADVTVTGIYAETGSASTTGGPWTVVFEVLL